MARAIARLAELEARGLIRRRRGMSAGRGAARRGWLTLEQKFVKLKGYYVLLSNPHKSAPISRANGLIRAKQVHERSVRHA